MPEYAKKTVAELQEILKSRSLPSSGKKAELVARLTEADKEAESQASEKVEPAPATAPAPAQAEKADAPADEAVPAKIPTTTDGALSAAEPVSNETEAAQTLESKTFALNLASSDVTDELAKRKARAARFGTGGPANGAAEVTEGATEDAAALKNLERAKRFGTGETAIGKLDEALSDERERGFGRKRKGGPAEEASALDDPGLRRGFKPGGRGGFRGRRRGGGGGDRPTSVSKPTGAFTNDKDRDAAEARRKRFAAA